MLTLPRDPDLARVFVDPRPSPRDVEQAIVRIRMGGALAEVAVRARHQLELACRALEGLPATPYRAALLQLVDGLVGRLS